MHFIMVMVTLLAVLAVGVFYRPEATFLPPLIWLIFMTVLEWRRSNREGEKDGRGGDEEEEGHR